MSNQKKNLHRYVVTAAVGRGEDVAPVGTMLLDTWHGHHYTWTILTLGEKGTSGSFTGRWIGRATDEEQRLVEELRAGETS